MIPRTFECMGMTVTVRFEALEDDGDSRCYGKYRSDRNEIIINSTVDEQVKEQTFWHEFMHCALGTLGWEELDNDEVFVEQMGQLLYQLQKTRSDTDGR